MRSNNRRSRRIVHTSCASTWERTSPETDIRTALATGEMGFLHSFTTGSTVDGPGVRVVAWTAGCTWRCLYCHNPDTWTMTNGIPVTVLKATEELRKYRQGLKVMNGGFTLSGGEPLMQHRFAVKLFAAARGMGIHTTLDTNGYYGGRLTDDELGLIDLVMLDIKTWDRERHNRLTDGRRPNAGVCATTRVRASADALRYVPRARRPTTPRTFQCQVCCWFQKRRARRRAPVSPDGPLQVASAEVELHARADAASVG